MNKNIYYYILYNKIMKQSKSFETFLLKAKNKYEDKYDYSKVEYVNSKTKVCIICPKHGEFYITPKQHLQGHGCTKCAKNGKWTTNKFITKAKEVHGDKYDYSKVEYINAHTKVCIICPKHGEFWQSATAHIRGQGCPHCFNQKEINKHLILNEWDIEKTSKFIKDFKIKHGDKYDYSKVRLNKWNDEICIICPIHGEFWQSATIHKKCGCPKCGIKMLGKSNKITFEDFINRAKSVHGEKYQYKKETYKGYKKKMCIVCPKHGEFWQTPISHFYGSNCPKCGIETKSLKNSLSTDIFISRAKQIHGNKYDYSKVKYINLTEKVCIICPKHGEFWQQPQIHLQKKGCPKCRSSKLELEIINLLEENNIKYEYQYKPKFLINYNRLYSYDFYLQDYNIIIECQGEQHFKPIDFSGHNTEMAKQMYKKTLQRDKIKYNLCKENKVKLIYYTNLKKDVLPINYFDTIYVNKNKLLSIITKYVPN